MAEKVFDQFAFLERTVAKQRELALATCKGGVQLDEGRAVKIPKGWYLPPPPPKPPVKTPTPAEVLLATQAQCKGCQHWIDKHVIEPLTPSKDTEPKDAAALDAATGAALGGSLVLEGEVLRQPDFDAENTPLTPSPVKSELKRLVRQYNQQKRAQAKATDDNKPNFTGVWEVTKCENWGNVMYALGQGRYRVGLSWLYSHGKGQAWSAVTIIQSGADEISIKQDGAIRTFVINDTVQEGVVPSQDTTRIAWDGNTLVAVSHDPLRHKTITRRRKMTDPNTVFMEVKVEGGGTCGAVVGRQVFTKQEAAWLDAL